MISDFVWRRAIDTSLSSPQNIIPYTQQSNSVRDIYVAQPRSVVVLEGH